jgi:hypothetical protein
MLRLQVDPFFVTLGFEKWKEQGSQGHNYHVGFQIIRREE